MTDQSTFKLKSLNRNNLIFDNPIGFQLVSLVNIFGYNNAICFIIVSYPSYVLIESKLIVSKKIIVTLGMM